MQGKRESLSAPAGSHYSSDLGYAWLEPGPPGPLETTPVWLQHLRDPQTDLQIHLLESSWRATDLREMIEQLGENPRGRSRPDLVLQLLQVFQNPDRLHQQWKLLSKEAQDFFAYLLLYTHFIEVGLRPTEMSIVYPFSQPKSVLFEELTQARLLIGEPSLGLYLPDTLYAELPAFLPFPDEPAPHEVHPAQDPLMAPLLLQQFVALVRSRGYRFRPILGWRPPRSNGPFYRWPLTPAAAQAVRAKPYEQVSVELEPRGPWLDDRALQDVAAALGVDREMVDLVHRLAVGLHLVRTGTPVTMDGQMLDAWLGLSPIDQWIALFGVYRQVGSWGDWYPAWRQGAVRLESLYYGPNYTPPLDQEMAQLCSRLRWALLGILSLMPSETWLSVEKMVAWIGRVFPDQASHPYQHLIHVGGDAAGWKAFLGHTVEAMLTGALRFLGLADVALDSAGRPVLFRIRHLRALQWDQKPTLLVPSVAELHPDGVVFDVQHEELTIRMPAPAVFVAGLQQWARLSGFSKNLFIYHLDARLLHDAFRSGATPASLELSWRELAGFEPHPALVAWWKQWWARFAHVRIYTNQVLLTTRDELTLREIQVALPELRASVLGVITPSAALIEPERAEQVIKGLQRQGYTPKEIA